MSIAAYLGKEKIMLGMRGMRDRWQESLDRAGHVMDKAVALMDKAIEYLDDLKRTTKVVAGVLDQQQKVLQQDLELKRVETRRIELEIKRAGEGESGKSTRKERRKSK